jgi:prolyl-tRNA editing enzyme YbaK/EbsC (Cys-tRNA(Pro) deacylase)
VLHHFGILEICKCVILFLDTLCFPISDRRSAISFLDIGIGLFVHPRTMRERYKGLVPQVDLANDYVSTDAYNQGARADFKKPTIHAAGGASMPSSTRGKINAWLPLVVNDVNWKYVSRYAPAAFSIIVRGSNDLFRPMHALQVCSRLMCTAVVQFCDNKLHLSERAVQLYCDVHRLLLQMIVEYPNIQAEATKKLTDFVQKEWSRGRDVTPDIGVLIQYLTVADGMQWPDFREGYIQESFRRSARWMESRIGRKLSIEESDEDLVRTWFEGSKVSMSLMLFNVLFLELVGRPENSTLDDVRKRYDQNWGRVTDDTMEKIKLAYKEIDSIADLQCAMARVGAKASTVPEIAALIRWAIQNEKEIAVPREIKILSDVGNANAAYQRLVVRRTHNATAPDKLREAVAYGATLAQAFNAIVSSFVPLPCTDNMLNVQLAAVVDGPIGFLRGQKPELIAAISLRFGECDHTIDGRAGGLGVQVDHILKEMLFLVDGQPVIVIKNGNSRVDTDRLGTRAKLCPVEYAGLHTSFSIRALCPFGHRVSQPVKVVISTSVSGLDPKTVIYTSAGCQKYFFAMTVEALLELLVGATQMDV